MKNKGLFILSVFTIAVLYVSVCSVFAAAPATQKNSVYFKPGWQTLKIYIMNPDGSGQVNLTRHRAADSDPVWSPTGEHILFVSDRSKNRRSLLNGC